MSTQTRLLDSKSVASILNKRSAVLTSHINKKVVLTVQGDGNVIDVVDKAGNKVMSTVPGEDGLVLQKKIFNLKASSELALSNKRNRDLFLAGVKAEKAGDKETAHEQFNAFLNATQLSFGIILGSAVLDKLMNGVDIAANIIRIDTENGSLLTIDPSTIAVKEPEVIGRTEFNIADFMDAEEEGEEEDEFTGMDRTALKAAAKKATVTVTNAMSEDAIRAALRAKAAVNA